MATHSNDVIPRFTRPVDVGSLKGSLQERVDEFNRNNPTLQNLVCTELDGRPFVYESGATLAANRMVELEKTTFDSHKEAFQHIVERADISVGSIFPNTPPPSQGVSLPRTGTLQHQLNALADSMNEVSPDVWWTLYCKESGCLVGMRRQSKGPLHEYDDLNPLLLPLTN